MSVADQVVQKTDDGYPMVSQWTSPTKEDDQNPLSVGSDPDTKDLDTKDPYPKALEDDVVGMTIDEIKDL